MKIQPYFDKLKSSKAYQDFISKNPEAYLSSGFFVLDFQTKKNMHQIDYYIPETKKMQTFILDGEQVTSKEDDTINNKIPNKISSDVTLDLDILKGLVEDEMKNHTITTKLQKIIAVIQNINGKLVWNLNCVTTDLGVLKVHISDNDHSVLKFDKINLFDVMKKK
tara:strand:+ start:7849 stop:8343 length:495 start_codon:yes stop_codon:yes gene_type:complete